MPFAVDQNELVRAAAQKIGPRSRVVDIVRPATGTMGRALFRLGVEPGSSCLDYPIAF